MCTFVVIARHDNKLKALFKFGSYLLSSSIFTGCYHGAFCMELQSLVGEFEEFGSTLNELNDLSVDLAVNLHHGSRTAKQRELFLVHHSDFVSSF